MTLSFFQVLLAFLPVVYASLNGNRRNHHHLAIEEGDLERRKQIDSSATQVSSLPHVSSMNQKSDSPKGSERGELQVSWRAKNVSNSTSRASLSAGRIRKAFSTKPEEVDSIPVQSSLALQTVDMVKPEDTNQKAPGKCKEDDVEKAMKKAGESADSPCIKLCDPDGDLQFLQDIKKIKFPVQEKMKEVQKEFRKKFGEDKQEACDKFSEVNSCGLLCGVAAVKKLNCANDEELNVYCKDLTAGMSSTLSSVFMALGGYEGKPPELDTKKWCNAATRIYGFPLLSLLSSILVSTILS